jgi:hypothetical protein
MFLAETVIRNVGYVALPNPALSLKGRLFSLCRLGVYWQRVSIVPSDHQKGEQHELMVASGNHVG